MAKKSEGRLSLQAFPPPISHRLGRCCMSLAMVELDLGRLTEWLSAGRLLLLTLLLVLLGLRGKDRSAMVPLVLSGAAAFLLALSSALMALGFPAPWFRLLAVSCGLVSILLVLCELPAWLQARPSSVAAALVEEKEQALGRLRETEAHLGIVVEEVREYAIYQLGEDGLVVSWNLGAERIKGWRTEEILGQPNSVFYPEEEVLAGKPGRDLEAARTQGSIHEEIWQVRKGGSRFMASVLLTALHDGGGRVTGYITVSRDITERLAGEERQQVLARDLEAQVSIRTAELQESEARLQGFIRHASAAICFKGLDGRLLLANRRAEALIGSCQASTPGGDLLEAFPPEVAKLAREHDKRVIALKEATQTEEEIAFPDGTKRNLLVQKFPLLDNVGRCWGIGVIATDITERKQAEQAHLQHQKLESIGLLAGGIAHDFNNLLGVLSGNLEVARMELGRDGPAEVQLQAMEGVVSRATNLVAQILAYAGKGKFQVQNLDLNLEVEGMIRLFRGSLARNVILRWEPASGLPAMLGDRAQIHQVVMNLMLNASDAVAPHGGTIAIRTGLVTLDQAALDRSFRRQDLDPGPHLTLEVADDGAGMAPGVLDRIFDPFFTTKFTGRGLGLAAVQGIIRSHKGGILVESQEGRGSTFKVFLPAAGVPESAVVPDSTLREVRFSEYRGSGTVLVVDDEDALRAVACGAFCRLGFRILEARDGLEALQVFEANRAQIRLILMDLTMPRMDGEEAFRELRRAGARMPIILSSGFGHEEAMQRFTGKGLAGFLQKPYRLQALVDAVREALGEDGAEPGRVFPPQKPVLWVPAFATGNSILDSQHQGLVEGFNHLLATLHGPAVGKGSPEEALHTFIGATVAHFGVEEGLMAEAGYPNARDHKAVHTHLTTQIQELAQELHRGQVSLTPSLLNVLEGWLLCHVQYEDRHFSEYLSRKGS
jgi:hemerythrin-like metal-binding protein/PAS domain S-box-containing protein